MNPEQQRDTLISALAIARTLLDDEPEVICFLVSQGRNDRYSVIDIRNQADRQQLLCEPQTHIRALITEQCIPHELDDKLLTALQSELDVAYSPNGKTSNAYDLGNFIIRAGKSISASA